MYVISESVQFSKCNQNYSLYVCIDKQFDEKSMKKNSILLESEICTQNVLFAETCTHQMNLPVYMYKVRLFKMKFLICVHDLIPTVPSPALNDKGPV